MTPLSTRSDVGWQCEPCGWATFSLDDMHRFVNWRNPDNSISLVCPRCGSEGRFIDAYRGDNAMPTFRKKPVEIQAVQWTGDNTDEVRDFLGYIDRDENNKVVIETLEGTHRGDVGDWIIRGVQGEFYPCKPDIFEATYDAA